MAGDPKSGEALEALYLRYRNLMYSIAYKLLGNSQDAEDAVQQAFVSIVENFPRISQLDVKQIRSYFVIVVERKAIDLLRRRGREIILDEEALPPAAPAEALGLEEAIAHLPPEERHALLLRYYCGFSTREITQQLGLSPAGVSRRIARAKELLREELEKEGITP